MLKNMRKTAKRSRAAPATPDFKFSTTSQPKMAVPFIKPHLMTVEQAAEIYPEITEMISFADKLMEEEDFEVAGLGISSGTLPPELMDAGGPVLLCRLHPALTNLLSELISRYPIPGHIRTIDGLDTSAINAWVANRGHGKPPIMFGFDLQFLEHLYTTEKVEGKSFERARLVFCAGDMIAFGGHYRDESDMAHALSYLLHTPTFPEFTNDLVDEIREVIAKHGRTPWLGNFYPSTTRAVAIVPVFRPEHILNQGN